jgi:hypothetical protein
MSLEDSKEIADFKEVVDLMDARFKVLGANCDKDIAEFNRYLDGANRSLVLQGLAFMLAGDCLVRGFPGFIVVDLACASLCFAGMWHFAMRRADAALKRHERYTDEMDVLAQWFKRRYSPLVKERTAPDVHHSEAIQ